MIATARNSEHALPVNIITRLEHAATRQVDAAEGVHVCWRQFGCGIPLVLLHGGHGSWMHWIRNIAPLSGCFLVWVLVLLGYGDSDSPKDISLASLLQPTLASLNTLIGAAADIDLAGFSFGGLVAAHLAAQRGKVGKLVLFGPAGHGGRLRRRTELVGWRDAGDRKELARRMRHNLAAHMLHDEASIDALALQVHTDSCIRTRFRSKDISHGGGLQQALKCSDAEMLLVWGEHDVAADPAVLAPTLTAQHPNRRAHIIPDAGHWVQYERADAVNRLLHG